MATISEREVGFGLELGDKPAVRERCLEAIRDIQKQLADELTGTFEVFDLGVNPELSSKIDINRDLDSLMQASIWHAIATKFEFKLKLLHTVDGYLSAVGSKNPVATFLLARYLVELVATVSEIDLLMSACQKISLRDGIGRATNFLAVLYRARHSTSDERFKSIFSEVGIPAEHQRPIRISTAIKRLTSRRGFSSANSIYAMLSNLCHHNGSGHKMLAERIRETDRIVTRGGMPIYAKSKAAAITLAYPASGFASNALGLTARVAWWSAHSANQIIEELDETPFTDNELRTITRGRIINAKRYFQGSKPVAINRKVPTKVRRNDPCPCGSEKKYKLCCGKA